MSYVLAFLGFSALILLHEAGHFAAAKAVGMRVERFSLFFGPLLLKVRRGETEYGIAPIPLGGYVKISGMNPREELPPEVVPRAYYNQPVWKRIFVILAGPAVNLAIAFIIVWALFMANGQAVATKQIGAVEKTSQAAGLLKPGDKLVSVDGVTGSSDQLRAQLATHRCAGAQVNGCLAQTPAPHRGAAQRQPCRRSTSAPATAQPTSGRWSGSRSPPGRSRSVPSTRSRSQDRACGT